MTRRADNRCPETDALLATFGRWGFDTRGYARNTRVAYSKRLSTCHRWLRADGRPGLLEVEPADLRAWLASLPANVHTRNHSLRALQSFYAFAVETGLRGDDPTATFVPLRTPRALPKALDWGRVGELLEVADREQGQRWSALVAVLAYQGMRADEVRTLRWDALEGEGWQWLRWTAKGSKDRVLPLHPEVRRRLRAWQQQCPDPVWVFPSPRLEGRPCSDGWIRQRLRAIGDAAGITGLHPHKLRHTFATKLVEEGVDLVTVQELMGHALLTTTQIYTKVRPERLVDAVGRL